jgi:hypothetical protein
MKLARAENERNARNAPLYEAILKAAYEDVSLVVAGHHIFVRRADGNDELPAADTLIFDHDIAKKIWCGAYKEVLAMLAVEPAESRDELLKKLFEQVKR